MHEGRDKKVQENTDSVLSLAVNPTLPYYATMPVQGACSFIFNGGYRCSCKSPKERQMEIVLVEQISTTLNNGQEPVGWCRRESCSGVWCYCFEG